MDNHSDEVLIVMVVRLQWVFFEETFQPTDAMHNERGKGTLQ